MADNTPPWELYSGNQQEPESGPWDDYAPAVGAEAPAHQGSSPSPGMQYLGQIGAGLSEGAMNMLGAPVDMVNNMVVAPALSGINKLFGTNLRPSETPIGGSAGLKGSVDLLPQPDDAGQQFARRVAQSIGSAAIPAATGANSARQLAAGLIPAAMGGAGAATAQQFAPGNPYAELAGELVGSLGTAAGMSAAANRSARKAAEASVPSVNDLKAKASSLYDKAEARGVVVDPSVTTKIGEGVRGIARAEEMLTPKGNVLSSYPRSADAMKLVDDYAGVPMSAKQVQNVRESLADHVFVAEGKDRNIARKMLSQFDRETAKLAPELSQARATYQRAMKGQELERVRELADVRASQFSSSGAENAIRTEYRGLDRRIVKGQEAGWLPAEIQAIENVSRGTPAQQAARNVGRFAPTGPVSFGVTAGVPFMAGNAVGGPMLGGAMAGGAAALGYGGRAAANAMQARNVQIAELLARNGGAMPSVQRPAMMDSLTRALLGEYAGMTGAE